MDLSEYKQNMQKNVDYFIGQLQNIQVGKANTNMLNNVNVETDYGNMKVPQLAHVSIMDSTTIKIEPWNKKDVSNIEKAVYDSDLGFTPKNEGEYVLIKIPEVTKERREELSKKIKSLGEEAKAHIRQYRQDALKDNKKLLQDKEISEDESNNNEVDIDNLTKSMNEKIDDLSDKKTEDVMSV